MKRAPRWCNSYSDGAERPAKLQRRHTSSTLPIPSNRQQKEQTTPRPPTPSSNNHSIKIHKPDRKPSVALPRSGTVTENEIFKWIPPPSDEFEVMNQPAPKRSRSRSISTDRGRPRSISPSTSVSSRDAKSNYVTILETKGCFMRSSNAGPIPDDVDLCERLLELDPSVDTPRGSLFDDEFIKGFHDILQNRSEARLLIDLHPLLMPSAENLFIQGREELKYVIDGYNDPWIKTDPIYGPKPQPDHAQGLKWSIFSASQRRKLGIKPNEKSFYAVREDMYFPYLTAEIKCGNQALEFANRQNMHSMCIALRAMVSLAQAASRIEEVHQRLLGFSISHELEGVQIYGYYPEIDANDVKYYRWPVKKFDIWTDKWACYRFVEKVNREFLPSHINRLMQFLEEIPDPQDVSIELDIDDNIGSQSQIASQERSSYSWAPSSQNRLQPELRNMIQTLQQQVDEQRAEQKEREEKLLAQMDEQRAEQKEREAKLLAQMDEQKRREEKLLAQMDEQRAEQKEREAKFLAQMDEQKRREEKLLAQMDEQRAEQKEREEKLLNQLFTLLEHKEK